MTGTEQQEREEHGMADSEPAFMVVVNDEEQYALWDPTGPVPGGWRAEGFSGSREEALAHIEEIWTDLRPLSLRTTAR